MEPKKTNSNLKAVVVVLSLLLVGSLAYIIKVTSEANSFESQFITEKTEKEKFLDSLDIIKTTYDKAINDNTTLSQDLITEREKVENLIADLKKSKGDAASMRRYRDQYNALQQSMKSLIAENESLKKANEDLTVQRDSTINVANEQKRYIDTLATKNESLSKTVEKASRLIVSNLKTQAIKQKSSGKQLETQKASRADKLKVCFTIAQNEIAKSGEKSYYVQIIDSKNNVLGEKKIEDFGAESLTYSFVAKVKYENKTVDVCEFLEGDDQSFEKGAYFVNIFDKNQLVSKTSFTLK